MHLQTQVVRSLQRMKLLLGFFYNSHTINLIPLNEAEIFTFVPFIAYFILQDESLEIISKIQKK